MSSYCLLFPGQGSQYVGMTCKLTQTPQAKAVYQTAHSVLGYDLQALCLKGPQEQLNQTVHCQPAVVVGSLIALQQLDPEVVSGCVATAGFSVGEITALIFAGAFSLEQGLQLIKLRAESMDQACRERSGSMLSLTNIEEAVVQRLCDEANTHLAPSPHICIANHMFPQGMVVSGATTGVQYVERRAGEKGAVIRPVAVSGAFHSKLMSSAVPKLSHLLLSMDISLPRIPVYSNVTGRPYSSVEEVRTLLADQVTHPVLWENSIRNVLAQEGPLTFAEVGPGKQLKAMLKRIHRESFKSCLSIVA